MVVGILVCGVFVLRTDTRFVVGRRCGCSGVGPLTIRSGVVVLGLFSLVRLVGPMLRGRVLALVVLVGGCVVGGRRQVIVRVAARVFGAVVWRTVRGVVLRCTRGWSPVVVPV